jgi:hypothetical protein
MGGIRRWFARQIAKAPGEWVRAHIADKIIEYISGHWLVAKIATAVIAIISSIGGLRTWFLAVSKHDPAIAILIGLSVSVLLFIVIGMIVTAIAGAVILLGRKGMPAMTVESLILGAQGNAAIPPSPLPDISWDFERPYWGRFGFLDLARSASQDQTVWVKAFHAQGHNNTDGPIRNISGIVRSDLNNKELPIRFRISSKLVRPEDTNGIPRDAAFFLESDRFSPSTTLGMTREEFLAQFGALTFELNYDGKKYVKHFSRSDSEHLISKLIANLDRASPKAPPMVTEKDCAARGD